MSDVPMPRDLTEEAVARVLWDAQRPDVDRLAWERIDRASRDGWLRMARAVLALVEAKVREGLAEYRRLLDTDCDYDDEIVARVMGKEATNG